MTDALFVTDDRGSGLLLIRGWMPDSFQFNLQKAMVFAASRYPVVLRGAFALQPNATTVYDGGQLAIALRNMIDRSPVSTVCISAHGVDAAEIERFDELVSESSIQADLDYMESAYASLSRRAAGLEKQLGEIRKAAASPGLEKDCNGQQPSDMI